MATSPSALKRPSSLSLALLFGLLTGCAPAPGDTASGRADSSLVSANALDAVDTGGDCVFEDLAADGRWEVYTQRPVIEDPNTFMPALEDFPTDFRYLIRDQQSLAHNLGGPQYTILGYSTWALVDGDPITWNVSITGDDSVGLWVDEVFVAGRANAEDPPDHGSITLECGWHHLQIILYNGPTDYGLEYRPAAGKVFSRLRRSL